jgi:hypothetical protein
METVESEVAASPGVGDPVPFVAVGVGDVDGELVVPADVPGAVGVWGLACGEGVRDAEGEADRLGVGEGE